MRNTYMMTMLVAGLMLTVAFIPGISVVETTMAIHGCYDHVCEDEQTSCSANLVNQVEPFACVTAYAHAFDPGDTRHEWNLRVSSHATGWSEISGMPGQAMAWSAYHTPETCFFIGPNDCTALLPQIDITGTMYTISANACLGVSDVAPYILAEFGAEDLTLFLNDLNVDQTLICAYEQASVDGWS